MRQSRQLQHAGYPAQLRGYNPNLQMSSSEGPIGDLAPLIVTALFDAKSFDVFDGLRRRHYPAHLNKISAHLSLFHRLPGGEAAKVIAALEGRCRVLPPMDLRPAGVRFLGRGVALAYESRELSRLHDDLASEWRAWLTPQDRQPFKAHVTIQNKAEPATARALLASFQGAELPSCRLDGVAVWRYLGGPWSHVRTCRFESA